MTLDPVHFDGIARLARRIGADVDEGDHRAFAETVWEEYLDPLYGPSGERAILEPLDEVRRRSVDVQDAALQPDRFPTSHGIDSGTINPTTFNNGLVLDVAQAAMSACPSDLDLHRERTIVMTAHTNDAAAGTTTDWQRSDDGYCRQRLIRVPRVSRYEEGVVHALALYMAESRHALDNAGTVDDLLYLDGPLYPKGMLNWLDRDQELRELLIEADPAHDVQPRDVVQRYVDLVERFVERDVPLVGFVKNPGSKAVTRALRERGESPWVDDAAFFRQVLERRERVDGEFERRTDQLTFTNWFVSRGGADRVLAADGPGDLPLERSLDPAAYEITCLVVYDPRDDVTYKIEAPRAITRDPDHRATLTRQLLREVAAERGPPLAIRKADELARISRQEKESLRSQLERAFDSDRDRTYDDRRWGIDAE